MGQLYQEKYKTDSNRLLGYNYADDGVYFVTICVQDRVCCLSDITEDKVIYTDIGQIIHDEITNIPNNRSNIYIDQFVIMPNHAHLILYIGSHRGDDTNNYKDREGGNYNDNNLNTNKNNTNSVEMFRGNITNTNFVETFQRNVFPKDNSKETNILSTENGLQINKDVPAERLYKDNVKNIYYQNISPKSGSLGNIIKLFKSYTTKNIRKILPSFMRQTNYYDVIIRSDDSLYEIRKYISNNPTKRKEDKLYI